MKRVEASEAYGQLMDKLRWSHQHGRNVFHLNQNDIDLARLFAYGYRSQTIGTFRATRTALQEASRFLTNETARSEVAGAASTLLELENEALIPVPQDFRAALFTLYRYDEWTAKVLERIGTATMGQRAAELDSIGALFSTNLDSVVGSNGLYIATDTHTPHQGTFQVPNLNITIVPVIYGDFHSWNFAYLNGNQSGVPIHRHRAGAEVHLGFGHVNGLTVLDKCQAEVREGYAMPIAPGIEHGFYNQSGKDHILPFVFGSLALGGWGIFFDVEPCQDSSVKHIGCELESADMNYSVWMHRSIERFEINNESVREIIVPAARTSTPETGGLELSLARITERRTDITSGSFRIVSIVRGQATVCVGPAEVRLSEHDHFGVPGGLSAHMAQFGKKPLVILDAVILPHVSHPKGSASGSN